MTTLFLLLGVLAQPTGGGPLNPPPNHPRSAEPTYHAFINATVHASPSLTLEHATLVIRDGVIVSLDFTKIWEGPGEVQSPPAPAGARVWDCSGLHIFPGFIEPFAEVDAPAPDPNVPGTHWNTRITPQRSALAGAGLPEADAKALRDLGFVAASISPRSGLIRGRAAAVSLGAPASDPSVSRPPVYRDATYLTVSLNAGGRRGFGGDEGAEQGRWTSYPDSQMGAIALLRQTFSDAAWQESQRSAGQPLGPGALDALEPGAGARVLLDASDELEALRLLKIAAEFEREPMLLASGYEFRRLAALERAGAVPVVVPLNFPRAPDVSTIARADSVEVRDLMTWEQAPTNPRRLANAGFEISLTTARLRSRSDFRGNLAKAMLHGLERERALAALTENPARLLGVDDRLGSIEAGKIASFVVADADLLPPPPSGEKKPKDATIRDVWIDGVRHEVNPEPRLSLEGRWEVSVPGAPPMPRTLVIDADLNITLERGDKSVKCQKPRLVGRTLSFLFDHEPLDGQVGIYAATGAVGVDAEGKASVISGTLARPDGVVLAWSAKALGKEEAKPEAAFLGSWRVTEADGEAVAPGTEGIPTITIEKDGKVSLVDEKGVSTPATDVEYVGEALRYRYDSGGVWADQCSIRDGVLVGVSTTPTGATHAWKAERRPDPPKSPSGRYRMTMLDGEAYEGPGTTIIVASTGVVRVVMDGVGFSLARDVKIDGTKAAYTLDMTPFGGPGDFVVSAERSADALAGTFTRPDGTTGSFSAQPIEKPRPGEVPEHLALPFGPYALDERPSQRTIAFTHATVWTSAEAGIIEDGSVVISGGKILFVGGSNELQGFLASVRLDSPPEVIDLRGGHLTPGLIDAHSHTGISAGVNESGQACTAEVRIQDVTDPDDISWYRQLAGGITAVNSMHGSANPIGGQTQTNKNRWGAVHPDDMHMEGAKPGIKFALGENVKQSNWGDANTTRYPQTRMGVEAFIRDRFTAAVGYADAPGDLPPRPDLELDALAEILAGERLVHCHSYRQDEILMLARIAREFGFRIGTYQHGLECYKVAEAVKAAAVGASLFSDWWAYKVEVQDAIPEAGPILHEQGVLVSFNSDSDELARRMNLEAAKAVKYGGLPREEALRFVTINPAIQLGIGARVGSIEPGKDADLALWSGDPLSAYSVCTGTFVDGREMFSLERDALHRESIARERERLIQKILSEDAPPAADSPSPRPRRTLLEQALLDARREHYLRRFNLGLDVEGHRCGDCGQVLY